MAITKQTGLIRSTYKATLRAAHKLDNSARTDLPTILGLNASLSQPTTSTLPQLRVEIPRAADLVRTVYRSQPSTASSDQRLDAAFALLSELNRAANLLDTCDEGSPRSRAVPFVSYRVGDVVEVPVTGDRPGAGGGGVGVTGTTTKPLPSGLRRGVIVGWDPVCQAGEAYKRASPSPSTRAQPHYVILLDAGAGMVRQAMETAEATQAQERAREVAQAKGLKWEPPKVVPQPPSPPSTPQDVVYVPQESVRPALGLRPSDKLLLHPLLAQYFKSFDPITGVYELTPELEALYPLDGYASTPLLMRVVRRLTKGAGGVGSSGQAGDGSHAVLRSIGLEGVQVASKPSSRKALPWVPSAV